MKQLAIICIAASIALLSAPAHAGDISNNTCDDCVIISNTTSSSRRRVNIQTFSNVRVRTRVSQNTGMNAIIANEDNNNPIIVTGNATSTIQQIIQVGTITINLNATPPPIFPE